MTFNFMTPLNNTSLGIVGQNLCKAFDALDEDFILFPGTSYSNFFSQELASLCKKRSFTTSKLRKDCPSLKWWHPNNINLMPLGTKRVGYTIFETTKFSDRDIDEIETLDRVIVPSRWAADIVKAETKQKEVHVAPLGVDMSVFFSTLRHETNPIYTFLNVGKLEVRKGHNELVEMFNKAFSKEDEVALVLMIDNQFMPPEKLLEWKKSVANTNLGSKIFFIEGGLSLENMNDVYNGIHCYISPSKAEGWNMPILEAMACGKPVITTDYSAHTEFCTSENSILIKPTGMERAYDGFFFPGSHGEWSTIDQDAFIEAMRSAFKTRLSSNDNGIKTARKYSWRSTAQNLLLNI